MAFHGGDLLVRPIRREISLPALLQERHIFVQILCTDLALCHFQYVGFPAAVFQPQAFFTEPGYPDSILQFRSAGPYLYFFVPDDLPAPEINFKNIQVREIVQDHKVCLISRRHRAEMFQPVALCRM